MAIGKMTDPDGRGEGAPPVLLPRPIRAIEALSGVAGVAAGVLLFTLFALMLSEVAARNVFGQSLHVTWEVSAYSMGAVFLLASSAAMREGDHVRVGILLELLPPGAARKLDLVVTLLAAALVLFIAYALGGLAMRSFTGDVRSWTGYRIPLAIPQAILALGAALFVLQLLARAMRLASGLPADRKRSDALSQ